MNKKVVSWNSNEGITKAVDFLNSFHRPGTGLKDLKRYLVNNQGLSQEQVTEALTIHQKDMESKTELSSKQNAEDNDPIESTVLLLRTEKQEEGRKLLRQFFKGEFFYCTILECLQKEYYEDLSLMAGGNEFNMTSDEVEQIFRHIPTLCKFHKLFYNDIYKGSNIGWMFVRHFNFFSMYVEYMKDCTFTVNKIREYILNDSLHRVLSNIRKRSKRRKDDMVDLLLVPLDRIVDYKNLLNKLYKYADKAHVINFEFLGKAVKKIKKTAKVVQTQKWDIANKNEMNKAQLFFGKQIDVLIPNRVILRRGMMAYKTGLASRKKMYMFFLFNDALVWTPTKAEAPKILKLWSCDVVKNSTRKLKLQTKGQFKVLNLECSSEVERDEWYEALESAIAKAKQNNTEGWSKFDSVDEKAGDISQRTYSLYQNYNRSDTIGSSPDGNGNGKSWYENKTKESHNLESSKQDHDGALWPVKIGAVTSFSASKAEEDDDQLTSDFPKVISPSAIKSPKLKENRKPNRFSADGDLDSESSPDHSIKRAGSSVFFLSLSEVVKTSPSNTAKPTDSNLLSSEKQISDNPVETRPKQGISRSFLNGVPKVDTQHKKSSSYSLRLNEL